MKLTFDVIKWKSMPLKCISLKHISSRPNEANEKMNMKLI